MTDALGKTTKYTWAAGLLLSTTDPLNRTTTTDYDALKDVDESKAFYTDVLGFEARDDITLGDGYRWCTVVHPSQPELMVSLAVPGPPQAPELVGTSRGLSRAIG